MSTEPVPLPRWLPFAACLAVAVGMTLPVWIAEEPSLLGHWEALDMAGSIWAHWWVADSLPRLANPFVGTASYFPIGLDPVLQYNLVDALVGTPWVWLAGPRVGYNLAALTALTTTGIGGYVLARAIGVSRAGALLSGITIEASSTVALELFEGRISQVLLVFWLLTLAGLVRLLRGEGGVARAVGVGVSAAAAALVYWYHGFALFLAGLVLVGAACRTASRRTLGLVAVTTVTGLAICLPFVLALLEGWTQLPGVGRVVEDPLAVTNMDSLKTGLAIATEHSRWPLWPLIGKPDVDMGHQLSLVTLVLAVWALRSRIPSAGRWLLVAAVGWVLAMGPFLQGWDGATDIPMPFMFLVDHLPTFDRMWWPQRFEVLTTVGAAILAGLGLDRWLAGRPRPALWLGGAIALSLFDAPFRSGLLPIRAVEAPEASAALYEGIEGPLLTTPVFPPAELSNRSLWIQTIHGQPTLNGDGEHIPSHRPPGFTEFVEGNALLSALQRLGRRGKLKTTIAPEAVDALVEAGFVYAVVDPHVYPGKLGRNWVVTHADVFRALWGDPFRVVDGGAIWEVKPIDEAKEIRVKFASGRRKQLR